MIAVAIQTPSKVNERYRDLSITMNESYPSRALREIAITRETRKLRP
jgi:hypothetical protein